jgi:fructose-1,6-bisphosphatase I
VSFDPLDGSGNIDCNVSIGTIFGIWKKKSQGKGSIEEDVLRKGNELIASGYCVYGASTIFVVAFAGEVNGFTYDPALGSFILSHPNIRIPTDGDIYSINEGNSRH